MDDKFIQAIKLHPEVLEYLTPQNRREFFKAAPITRDELERRIARAIYVIDKEYLSELERLDTNIPYDFWQTYENNLRDKVAPIMRQHIETAFSQGYVYDSIVDRDKVIDDMDKKITASIMAVIAGIVLATRSKLAELIASGIPTAEIIERIAYRFGTGHAEQVAITEITTLEGDFAESLSNRLLEQGIHTQIRILTAEDERVCPICGPADHKLYDQPISTSKGGWNGQSWKQRFGPKGAHTRCRCERVVELKKG